MFYFFFGLIIGSFLNVVIYRIPRGESIAFPPSHCPSCQHRLGVWDLIPVLSYVFLRGRCRYCRSWINPRYPLVELITGFLTLLWAAKFQSDLSAIMTLVFLYILLVIGFIDYERQIIPNLIVLPATILFLLYRLYQGQLLDALIGGLLGGGFLLIIALLYPKGMGMGDVKLMTMAGALLGWEKVITAIFLGSFIGTVILLPFLCLNKITRKTALPFGPFLVFALVIMVFKNDVITFILS